MLSVGGQGHWRWGHRAGSDHRTPRGACTLNLHQAARLEGVILFHVAPVPLGLLGPKFAGGRGRMSNDVAPHRCRSSAHTDVNVHILDVFHGCFESTYVVAGLRQTLRQKAFVSLGRECVRVSVQVRHGERIDDRNKPCLGRRGRRAQISSRPAP